MRAALFAVVVALVGCGKKADAPKGDAKAVVVAPADEGKGRDGPKPKEPRKEVAPKVFPPDDWTHKELIAHLFEKGIKVHVRAMPTTNGRVTATLLPILGKGEVIVALCRDAQDAREQAGILGGESFSRGRFAFGNRPFPNGGDLSALDNWAASEELLGKIAAATR